MLMIKPVMPHGNGVNQAEIIHTIFMHSVGMSAVKLKQGFDNRSLKTPKDFKMRFHHKHKKKKTRLRRRKLVKKYLLVRLLVLSFVMDLLF